MSGSMTYTITPHADGSLVVSFSGHFTYHDQIDMNSGAGDTFFCYWTDPMGGGHDYDFSATWGILGQVTISSKGTAKGHSGYPYFTPNF